MKKGKKSIISKVDNSDFSLDLSGFSMEQETENPFPGFDIPPVQYTGDKEKDAADELRYVHDTLLWVDAHPPVTKEILDSSIFLTVVFESRSQLNDFLTEIDMHKYSDKYFSAHTWAKAFGIDLENGKPASSLQFRPEDSGPDLNLDLSLDFNLDLNLDLFPDEKKTEKPVIGETLKNIRDDEKRTAEYLAWAVDPSFWFCICFNTEEQKANFLLSLGIKSEKHAGFDVIWCHDFAAPFKVELETCTFKPRLWSGKEDKKLTALVWNGESA